MARYPGVRAHCSARADMVVNGAVEVAIVGDPDDDDFARSNGAVGGAVRAVAGAGGRPSRSLKRNRAPH